MLQQPLLTAPDCRRRAAECVRLAAEAREPTIRQKFLEEAQSWEQVARGFEFEAALANFLNLTSVDSSQKPPSLIASADGP